MSGGRGARVSGNGLPRVASVGRVGTVGGPYDTSDLREVLARLRGPSEGAAPAPTELEPGAIVLPRRLAEQFSGFLDRLLEENASGRNAIVPQHHKDPSGAEFGVPTRESTITWGSTVDMSFEQNPPVGPEPNFPIQSIQLLHVQRPRPTTHTVLVVVALGSDWNGENQTTFTIFYTLGVGQGMITIPKKFVLTVAQLVAANNTVPIVDLNTYPFQSLQVGVSYTLSPANNGVHGVTVAAFTAPVVQ